MQRHVAYLLVALGLLLLGLYALGDVLLPFVAGAALAYLLDPVADRLQRLGLGRLGATLLILVLFVLVFVLLRPLVLPNPEKKYELRPAKNEEARSGSGSWRGRAGERGGTARARRRR